MRHQKIYLVYSEVLLKKKKRENKCKWHREKLQREWKFFGKFIFKINHIWFQMNTHTHTHTHREIDSEVSIVQRYATVSEERRNGVNVVNWQMF